MTYVVCFLVGLAGMILGLCIFAAAVKLRRNKKRPEFSKQILVVVAVGTVLIVLFSCRMMWVTGDLSPLAYLIPSIFVELSVGTAFYYNKAKAENEIKLRSHFPEQEQQQEHPFPPQ